MKPQMKIMRACFDQNCLYDLKNLPPVPKLIINGKVRLVKLFFLNWLIKLISSMSTLLLQPVTSDEKIRGIANFIILGCQARSISI